MRNWNQGEALSGRHLLTELVRPRRPTIWNIYDLPPISSTSSTPSSTERIEKIEEGEALQGTGKDHGQWSFVDHNGEGKGDGLRMAVDGLYEGRNGIPMWMFAPQNKYIKTKSASKPVLSSTAGRWKQGYNRIRP